ncbi:MAG TPA: mechanosensitive ion channel family protein [Anaerolineae bacterium]|nr:mechanosensitive ion channel family protein [Anaerolineae bacterium]
MVFQGKTLRILVACFLTWTVLGWSTGIWAQEPPVEGTPEVDEEAEAPGQVDVQPIAQDEQIDERLTRILQATEWFVAPEVEVRDGVVFLDGSTFSADHRQWAGDLARNTQDVVAVVNRLEVNPRWEWDFSPALAEMRALWLGAIQAIPLFLFGVVVLALSWWLMRLAAQLLHYLLRDKLGSPLLSTIAARVLAVPVFLLGLYFVLQVAGLTRLALTVLGGTGIVGIVIGFAFRDIAENFLASVLLSVRKPFRSKDLIEVAGYTGIVQQMNTRSTILMTFDGNHIQIPNSTVFKNTIVNYTANPNRRSEFGVGIGYDASIVQAQALIAQVLDEHPAVLETPESLVLVDELGAATVNLRVYFWYDATLYAPIKIKSSLIRLTKRALEEAGISMPDEAREVVFPRGVPLIQPVQERPPQPQFEELKRPNGPRPAAASSEPLSSTAEGNLFSEEQEIHQQAARFRPPEEGADLLVEP